MQVHSLKLTIQDMPDKNGKLFATVSGTLTIDTGEKKKNDDGTDYVDAEGDNVAILEDINFMSALNSSKELKACVQGMIVEALTLKNMQVSKKVGQMSHYVESLKPVREITRRHPRIKNR